MKSFRAVLITAILGHLSCGVYSWVLDETCRSAKIDEDRKLLDKATGDQQNLNDVQGLADPKSIIHYMVEEALAGAKDTATAVVEVLDENPQPKEITDMLKDLFASHPDAPGKIKGRFEKDKTGTNGVLSILDPVEKARSEYDTLPSHEVVVFCDETRLITSHRDPQKYWYDTVTKSNYDKDKTCSGKGKPKAWTSRGVKFDSIQICPDYLEKIKEVKYRTLRGTKPDTWKEKLVTIPMRTLRIASGKDKTKSEIDFTSRGEQTMLHELMHTKAGGGAADVGSRCYEWTNCKDMAAANPENAMRNAESNAFFALGVKLYKEGIRVDTNGDLRRGKDGKKIKRQQEPTSDIDSAPSDRWIGSSVARAALVLPGLR